MNDAARYSEAIRSPGEVIAGFTSGLDLADVPDDVVESARLPKRRGIEKFGLSAVVQAGAGWTRD